MAKKSTSNRSRPLPPQAKGVARKPQAPERASTATLVRAPGIQSPETPSAANVVAETAPTRPATQSAAKPAPRPTERRTAVAEKPAAPRPAPAASAAPTASKPAARQPAATTSSREQNQRLARARATQRARQANLISAENYAYVLGDLKLVVALAVTAFAVLIALAFVLPH
jgi:cobalamin biosynthesis Mg chelatase CobN